MSVVRLKFIRCFAAAAVTTGLYLAAHGPATADDLRLRYSWKLKGEYAPFYLALEKGYYSDANLTVRMGEGVSSSAAFAALLQGQEDAVIVQGVAAITAAQKGMPVKIIALFQPMTPASILGRPGVKLDSPKDLEGKILATTVGGTSTEYLDDFCTLNGIDCSLIRRVRMDPQARVPALLQSHIDMMGAFATEDIPAIEYRTGEKFPVLDMTKYGLAVAGLAIVTTDENIAKRSDLFRRYLAATQKGIAAAHQDPAAAVDAIAKNWPGAPPEGLLAKQVAISLTYMPATQNDVPAGWIDNGLIDKTVNFLKSSGEAAGSKPIESFYTNSLLAP